LLAIQHVGHRRARRVAGQRHFPHDLAGIPVSGSNAAPDQLAPPAMPGIAIVGFSREGGVNSGP
jgi:hypothetical protein